VVSTSTHLNGSESDLAKAADMTTLDQRNSKNPACRGINSARRAEYFKPRTAGKKFADEQGDVHDDDSKESGLIRVPTTRLFASYEEIVYKNDA